MTEEFTLQHADIPQPVLLDIDPVTNKWPMPPPKPWVPVPRTGWPPGMLQDDCRELSKWLSSRLGALRRFRQ